MRLKRVVFVCLLLLGIFLTFIPQVIGQSTDSASSSPCQQTTFPWFTKPPSDQFFCLQWNFGTRPGINLEEAWDATKLRGEKVKVALPDNAIHYTDGSDFRPDTFLPGYDYENNQVINDPKKHLKESSLHGTIDAAIISQDTDNGKGSAGIAEATKIIPYRIPDTNRYYSDEGATADAILRGTEQGADIINLSLDSSKDNHPEIQSAAQQAYDQNVLLVVASGNLKPDRKPHPIIRNSFDIGYIYRNLRSNDPDGRAVESEPQAPKMRALVVAARDNQGNYPGYSNTGYSRNSGVRSSNEVRYAYDTEVNLSAPGGSFLDPVPKPDGCQGIQEANTAEINRFKGGIAQTDFLKGRGGNVVIICQGTSQAATHASGVASLVISVLKEGAGLGYDQRIDPDLVISIIEQSAHVSEYRTKQNRRTSKDSKGGSKRYENYFDGYSGIDGSFRRNGHSLGHEHPLDAGVAVKLAQAFVRDASHWLTVPISVDKAEAEVAKVVWKNRVLLAKQPTRKAIFPTPSTTPTAQASTSAPTSTPTPSETGGKVPSQLLKWSPWVLSGLITCGAGVYLFIKVSRRSKSQ